MRRPGRRLAWRLAIAVGLGLFPLDVRAQNEVATAQHAPSDACPKRAGWRPSPEELKRIVAAHGRWLAQQDQDLLGYGELSQPNLPGRAVLCRADLREASLDGASLPFADLTGADLEEATLTDAKLSRATLTGADLSGATLTGAAMIYAKVDKTRLAFANFASTMYAPASPPPDGYLEGIMGLETVTFPPGQHTGLVQLRKLLQEHGLREEERAATRALERTRAWQQLCQSLNLVGQPMCSGLGFPLIFVVISSVDVLSAAEAAMKMVLFGWTTDYGLRPGMALRGLFWFVVIGWAVYFLVIWTRTGAFVRRSGVFIELPKGRIESTRNPGTKLRAEEEIKRLRAPAFRAVGWALWFSLLSAFHIGFREFSVGQWLTRVQPSEFGLRSHGWVRVVSGLQSLLNLYLLAIWALTYFGRPFE